MSDISSESDSSSYINDHSKHDDFDVIWSDTIPIPQDEDPNALVAIQYSPIYRKLMDLFRAVIKKGEYSERVLDLTERILDINAANYTIWQYRRDCLRTLNSDLEDEFEFMDSFAEENPKNYQIWYHRRAIVEMKFNSSHNYDYKRELEFCNNVFEVDSKNYHAWAHRQWVLRTFNDFEGELQYVEELLQTDIRNNSAWNHRWFIIHSNQITEDILNRELAYTFTSLAIVTLNESPWNYLRGLLNSYPQLTDQILQRCNTILNQCDFSNVFALSLAAYIREKENTLTSLLLSKDLYGTLIDLDKIRSKYWIKKLQTIDLFIQQL